MISLDAFNSIKASAETNTRIFTPQKIVKEMLNALPPEVWNSNTTFLDPAVKSGIYLVEIFNKLMESPAVIKDFPDPEKRRENILQKQLYGITIDQFDCLIAQRNLYGSITGDSNIRFIEKYMDMVKNKDSRFYIDAVKKEFGEMKKFGVIIGNPPYQDKTQSIYQHFIDKAINLNPEHITMVVKNNWLNSDTLRPIRDSMIKFGLQEIVNYPMSGEIFKDIGVAVNIFYLKKGYVGKTHYKEFKNGLLVNGYEQEMGKYPIIFSNPLDMSIVAKIVSNITDNGYFSKYAYPCECSRINSNFTIGRGINTHDLSYSIIKDEHYNTAVACMDGRELDYVFVNREDVPALEDILDKYKVIIGRGLGRNQNVISNLNILDKHTTMTSSWGIIYVTDDLEIAKNVCSYAQTRVFRFLLRLLLGDGLTLISPYRFSLVPIQDFSHPWTDEMLYKKYNLTEEEIAYIEQTIKPMS